MTKEKYEGIYKLRKYLHFSYTDIYNLNDYEFKILVDEVDDYITNENQYKRNNKIDEILN